LELLEELERLARRRKIAVRINRECRPDCVAPEEPGEARPLAIARSAEAREQARPEQGIGRSPLVGADLRPGERGV
jgi:hypothetical protein